MRLPRWDGKLWQNHKGRLVLALVAGVVFPFAFAPFNLWPLAVLALLVLYQTILNANHTLQIIGLCFVFAIGKYGAGAYWIFVSLVSYADIHLLVAISLFATFLVLTGVLFSLLAVFATKSRFALLNAMVFASGLTVIEILFSLPWPLSFPWLHLGYALIDTPLSFFAPYGGVWAVSFAGVFTAAALCRLLSRHWYATVVAFFLWIPGLFLSSNQSDDGESISVALVQGNISITDKWEKDGWREALMKYIWLTDLSPLTDLVVWPESAVPVAANVVAEEIVRDFQDLDGRLIFGSLESVNEAGHVRTFNVGVAFDRGKLSYFRKEQLVPFGEYIPWRTVFGDVLRPIGYPMSNLQQGISGQSPLQVGDLKLGTAICYEIAYPHLVRRRVSDADVIVVLSEDSWFGETSGPWQHMQIARMRALELNRPLVRATNDGVTATIDADGSVLNQLPRYREDVLLDTVKLSRGDTIYGRFGLLPIALLIVVVLFLQTFSHRFAVSRQL